MYEMQLRGRSVNGPQAPRDMRFDAETAAGIFILLGTLTAAGSLAFATIYDWIVYISDREARARDNVAALESELAAAREELDRLEEARRIAEDNKHLDDQQSGDSSGWW